ncbi:hypothetical protein HELRODRAFT_192078 [Helobdella robusta]|uniref:Uncharacterized protein n=1 Tax=Helobdella robusta TaxID=6412 RepID=T1FTK1_HELRO|nr:hypothetical protein HELRODRAFT_192078 [Helobdella robusta]ESO03017.1 hypothetical protein HELRODRAFT_192078 [Helobdella robusta]
MYSVAMTFTVLVLLIKHFNKDSMNTLTNFVQYTQTASNSQKLDIEAIHTYARNEIMRQHQIANQTRHDCELKLNDLQEQLENAKQAMSVHRYDAEEVANVAREYTKVLVRNLTNNINKFKQEFTAYANRALEKLKRSIVQTSNAIESSKWMDGPKIIYEEVKRKRSKVGKSTKPFLEWAGIKQEVDRLVADLSLKDFPMPNLTEFLNTDIPKSWNQPMKIPRASDVILPRNQWYYHYDKKPPQPTADDENENADDDKKVPQMMSFTTFIIILMVIDAVWFIHRIARTYFGAQMMLHGCPIFISCRLYHPDYQQEGPTEETQQQQQQPQQQLQPQQQQPPPPPPPQASGTQQIPPPPPTTPPTATKPSKLRSCLSTLRDINFKIMKTEFIPKMVSTVAVGCALYIGLSAADKLLSVKSLVSIGYFDALVAPLETNYRLAGTRVKTNAYRINKLEFPFFEELVNIRYKRYQLLLEMYAEVLRNSAMLKDSEYCMWKKLLDADVKCNCTDIHVEKLHFDGCHLPHIVPVAYHKKDFSEHKEQLSRAILPYIDASRDIVMDTGHLVALFVAILALVDALSNVIWIYFKRFNLLRLKPLFEIEHIPMSGEQRT